MHNKIREQFRSMPDEFMTSTIAGTSKVTMISWFDLCRKFILLITYIACMFAQYIIDIVFFQLYEGLGLYSDKSCM